jgi:hypothetical protein
MREVNNRALKEWASVCEALKDGTQTVLIRKGGIREEDGLFRVDDAEFFLMPTYDHQTMRLVRPEHMPTVQRTMEEGFEPNSVKIDAYMVVDTVAVVKDEERLGEIAREHIWNDEYIRMRLDFNPYDSLYVMLLRAYRLPERFETPMRPEYAGCKSWVTLERMLSTAGAVPAIEEAEFARRRMAIRRALGVSS